MNILFVALGGACGSVLRYLVSRNANVNYVWFDLPIGTILVNIVGCFLIGFLSVFLLSPERENYRLLLIVGFLGGFTTFSAFGIETFQLIQNGKTFAAFLNVAISLVLGLGAVALGYFLSKRLF